MIYSQRGRKFCPKAKGKSRKFTALKLLKRQTRTPQQEAETIQKAIADLDYRLESTGEMSSDVWCCLYDAQRNMKHAMGLMPDCELERRQYHSLT